MSILTKDQILSVEDLQTKNILVKEWGGDVIIRTMRAIERDRFEDSMFKGNGPNKQENLENLRARFLSLVMIDEKGERMFKSHADVIALGKKSAKVLDFLFTEGRKLNGMTEEDVEELTKNLSEGQEEDFLSD